MTQPTGGQGDDDDLQFSTVEPAANQAAPGAAPISQKQAQVCVACKRPILDYYYTVRDQVICGNCQPQIAALFQAPGAAGIARATLYGLGAGIAGALVWFAVLYISQSQWGIIAVAVGYIVAKSVRKGAGRAGGPILQIIAVAITYLCIGLNYDLLVLMATKHRLGTVHFSPAFVMSLVQGLFTLPIELNLRLRNPIGLLIVGFALWEAWKLSSPARLVISGPYAINPAIPPTGSAT